jgi:hypothetical protein
MNRRPCLHTPGPNLPLFPGENHTIPPVKSDVRSVLPSGYFLSPWHAGWRRNGRFIFPVHFSLYVNDMPVASRRVELAFYADDTAVIAMSRKPALLVGYLESYLAELDLWLRIWRHGWQANSRGFWSSIFRRPHQNPDREFRLEGSRCGETLSPATR